MRPDYQPQALTSGEPVNFQFQSNHDDVWGGFYFNRRREFAVTAQAGSSLLLSVTHTSGNPAMRTVVYDGPSQFSPILVSCVTTLSSPRCDWTGVVSTESTLMVTSIMTPTEVYVDYWNVGM